MARPALTRFAWLSIAAALTIGLKAGAYALTGSVGLLSDALESVVNLVAAIVALLALTVAGREPAEEHAYGHEKAEYFSSGIEGGLILLAAASIAYACPGSLSFRDRLGQRRRCWRAARLGREMSTISTSAQRRQ